jgi:hypothetical protein
MATIRETLTCKPLNLRILNLFTQCAITGSITWAKAAKLRADIRNNPKDVRFDDACKAAEMLGFRHVSGRGNHRVYARTHEPVGLNFQNRKGRIKPYQARQLIEMIDKYEDEL